MWWCTSTACSSPRPERDAAAMRGDPWFIYRLSAGRFRAAPARWQGWAVLIGGILITIAATILAMTLAEDQSPAIRMIAGFVPILVGIGAILLTAYRTGRPSL